MGQEIDGEVMGEEYKGYIFRITGGNDKQGFAMKQGILINGRTRILFKKRKYPTPILYYNPSFCQKNTQLYNKHS